ncbi:MAG: Crp/Fnr family transcriptional regulator [Colwellia sp.]|jgi:CRP/FNR family transcriptional regulator|nr:MAG: Crp/Fnr family transcriptional regulator [Colwellia sp.]
MNNSSVLFATINDSIGQKIISNAKKVSLPASSIVFYQGASCENYLLLTKGVIKVFTRAINGREILLYRVNKGQSCMLTTTCLLANNDYPAEGVTETDIEALMISLTEFNLGLAQSPSFREFVFNTYGQRLRDVISLVGDISFNRIDIRLAKQLLNHANQQNRLTITHQALAFELGTAREVVSRQLKSFEKRGLLRLSRGEIQLDNQCAIETLAGTPLI